MASSCRSQSGGLGKRTGRSMKRTMQRRKGLPRRVLLAETGVVGGDSLIIRGSLEPRGHATRGFRGPTAVGLAARAESAAVKVGKVSRVASALPHSEGAAYKWQ